MLNIIFFKVNLKLDLQLQLDLDLVGHTRFEIDLELDHGGFPKKYVSEHTHILLLKLPFGDPYNVYWL